MRILRDFSRCPDTLKGAFVALGNFDGVHLGHRAILDATLQLARAAGRPAAVMTFEPHPREFFSRSHAPFHICALADKLALLRQAGIDIVYLARFNAALAATGAQDFVEKLLVGQLGARHVITGFNFAFGKGRQGDTAFLDRAAAALGVGYSAIAPVLGGERPISSSAIRECLAAGDMAGAGAMLGRPYGIGGHVRHGDARGRALGFATANLALRHLCRPRFGAYAARARVAGELLPAVANIGLRPTFHGTDPVLECHFLDASRDVYGQHIRVELVRFLRDEQKFDSPEALTAQIARDCDAAREALAHG